jgi:hypothetical protein
MAELRGGTRERALEAACVAFILLCIRARGDPWLMTRAEIEDIYQRAVEARSMEDKGDDNAQ